MAAFITKTPSRIVPVPEDNLIKNQPDDGPIRTRKRATKARLTFPLEWKIITAAEMQQLSDFHEIDCSDGSLPFLWIFNDKTNPKYFNKSYNVFFTSVPAFEPRGANHYSARVVLMEV
jgi:hypothetical protein